MPDALTLRDSTQIVLPRAHLGDGVREALEDEFTVTIFEEPGESRAATRVIGSPVEIKRASEYLTRQGVSVP